MYTRRVEIPQRKVKMNTLETALINEWAKDQQSEISTTKIKFVKIEFANTRLPALITALRMVENLSGIDSDAKEEVESMRRYIQSYLN